MDHNNQMEFKDFCECLTIIKQTTGSGAKANATKEYFKKWKTTNTKENMFSLLRLILPKLDRARQSYNMKESKVARVLIKMLALPPGHDQNVLKKSHLMSGQASDFGDVVYSVIRKYLAHNKTTLKIEELNMYLDKMANRNNESEAEDILMQLFKKCSAEHSRWIIRIILKDLKLGIDGNRILNCYHKDGAQYYACNNNLTKVSEVLYEEHVNAHELDIAIFEPFRPMLSKRVDNMSFKKDFEDNKLFYIENKFDGERFQLHMEYNKFKYFSRNGFDFTDTFGSSYEEGILTPKLRRVFDSNVKRIILDGEMMLWNTLEKKYGSKGMELDVKKLKGKGKYQPCFCIYDIILYNETILTNKPLRERVGLLREIFNTTLLGILVLSDIKEVYRRNDIVEELNKTIHNEEEGIIIKDPESVYKYSDRNSGWFKMKLEYFQDTMNDLDVILMGGQYASSTSDQLNSFIVGVKSGITKNGHPIYLSFGKVASGLTNDELEAINKKLKTYGRPFNTDHSASIVFGKEKPDFYIEPEHSTVFEIRASELIRNTDSSYKTTYTLRFPRILKIRNDKPVEDCLTMNELLELTNKNSSVIKLNKQKLDLDELLKIKSRNVKKKAVFVPNYGDSTQVSDILEDYRIYVFNVSEQKSRNDIENIIRKAGGQLSYRINDTVDIVLVGTYNEQVKMHCSIRNHYDVISVNWLYRVIKDGNLLAYDTVEIYCLGTNPKNCLSDEVDRYGDSYTEKATVESIKHCFNIMSNLNEVPSFGGLIEVSGRRNYESYTAYFDKYETIDDPKSTIIYSSFFDELEFKYYNGNTCQTINNDTNLIIYNDKENREYILQNYLKIINRSDIEIRTNDFLKN